jgi:hypothetical protein
VDGDVADNGGAGGVVRSHFGNAAVEVYVTGLNDMMMHLMMRCWEEGVREVHDSCYHCYIEMRREEEETVVAVAVAVAVVALVHVVWEAPEGIRRVEVETAAVQD